MSSWKNPRHFRQDLKHSRRTQRLRKCQQRLEVESLEERALLSASLVGVPTWIDQGPNPLTLNGNLSNANSQVGAIQSVAVETLRDPAQHPIGYIAYAGTVNGGVWRSDDLTDAMLSGPVQAPPLIHWRPLTDRQPSLAISSLAIDPSDHTGRTLWVGTGSRSSGLGFPGQAIGLLKTTDGTDPSPTWTVLGNQTVQVNDVSLAEQPIIRVVPTSLWDSRPGRGQIVLVANGQGIFESNNGGMTFQAIVSGFRTIVYGNATDLVADPTNPQRFYAAIAGRGVFRGVFSADNSSSVWTQIDNGSAQVTGATNLKLAFFTSPGRPTKLYVGTAVAGNFAGVFFSTNPDSQSPTWASVSLPTQLGPVAASPALFGLTADPTNPNVFYVDGYGNWIFRGDTSNNTWSTLVNLAVGPHGDFRSLTFLNDHMLLATSDGGIWGLDNPQDPVNDGNPDHVPGSPGSLSHWVSLNNSLEITEFYQVAYDPKTGFISGGAQDVGTPVQTATGWTNLFNHSADGGETEVDQNGVHYYFDDLNFFRDGNLVQMAARNPNGTIGPLFSGLSQQDRDNLNANAGRVDGWFPFTLNPVNPSQLLLAVGRVYESMTQGDTITDVTPMGMTGTITPYGPGMAYGVDNPNAVYLATTTGQLFMRTPLRGRRALFHPLAPPQPGAGEPAWTFARQIVVDPDNYQHAYVLEENNGRIWEVYTRNAVTWRELTSNLANQPVYSIAVYDPTPNGHPGDSVLLAGTPTGVYRRLLHATASHGWYKFGSGLPNAPVLGLHYAPRNPAHAQLGDVLLAGTYGRGAWTVQSAGAAITNPAVLTINLGVGEILNLFRDPKDPAFLDVTARNGNTPNFSVEGSTLQQINITSPGQNVINIADIPDGVTVSVTGQGSGSTLNLGNAAHTLADLQGLLTVRGVPVIVSDQGYSGRGTYYLFGNTLQVGRLPGFALNYDSRASLALTTGGGGHIVRADFGGGNPFPTAGFTYDGGAGINSLYLVHDTFQYATDNPTGPTSGSLTLSNNGFLSSVTISYANVRTIYDTAVSAGPLAPPNYLTFNAPSGANAINVQSTQISSTGTFATLVFGNRDYVTVNSQSASDVITLTSPRPGDGLVGLTINAATVTAANRPQLIHILGTAPGVNTTINANDGWHAIGIGDDTHSLNYIQGRRDDQRPGLSRHRGRRG